MYKNKILIGFLIFILIVMLSILVFLFFTKDKAAEEIAKKHEEVEEDEDPDISIAEYRMFENPYPGEEIAIMDIKNYGKIKIKFFDEVAPKAVENFIGLAKKGYYNNVTFHRVIEDFMIQGGDPTGAGTGGESFFGSDFGPEYKDGYFPYKGTLCMASVPGIENSLSSQFFIVQAGKKTASMEQASSLPESISRLYMEKGGAAHLYKQHTVFGYVYEGMDIVDKIAATKTDDNDKPLKDVIIKNIKIEEVKERI